MRFKNAKFQEKNLREKSLTHKVKNLNIIQLIKNETQGTYL